ncbi:hypothetical protein B0H63DRAFT_23590 [Podospora didyma]|uniref:Helix-turn-helix domain-containing protein n=1 Tax=Podospora didyma TaxID=330526 RepID=A0AAE0P5E7_9PEZI|nr:hypothetical protein B0H63DRAFT_23590 [Podospora didyma]
MGASSSKAAQKAARKFPTRGPRAAPSATTRSARPSHPETPSQPQASYTKDDAIRADSINPDRPESMNQAFANRLKQMGIAKPNPTYSPSSIATPAPDAASYQSLSGSKFSPATGNATLGVLESRRRLQELADQEFDDIGKSGDRGREFLDIATIRDALILRQRGEPASSIEARLRLKPGVIARLGSSGIVAPTTS